MKKFLKFVGILIVLLVVALGALMYFTSDATQSVNDFFTAIKTGDYSRARNYLSGVLKGEMPANRLENLFPPSRYSLYEKCSWSSREVTADGTATLKGSIIFTDNTRIPAEIHLIKEGEKWKILSINLQRPSIVSDASNITEKSRTSNFYVDNCFAYQERKDYTNRTSLPFLKKEIPKAKVTCQFHNTPANLNLVVEWYYLAPSGKQLINRINQKINSPNYTGPYTTYLELPQGKVWPEGEYEVVLKTEGKALATTVFSIK